jgi:hypothetical protein
MEGIEPQKAAFYGFEFDHLPADHAEGQLSRRDSSRSTRRNSENGIPLSVDAARPIPIKSTVLAS